MQRIQSILGYSWALLAIPLVLATFVGMQAWAALLARSTGVQVSPWYTGGEVARTVPHEGYETRIHRPVFDGLLSARKQGFVQADWVATGTRGLLPDPIDEKIDFDGDDQPDFTVHLSSQTGATKLSSLAPAVIGLDRSYLMEKQRTIRVSVRNSARL